LAVGGSTLLDNRPGQLQIAGEGALAGPISRLPAEDE
jgi:hypothetical protein